MKVFFYNDYMYLHVNTIIFIYAVFLDMSYITLEN